ncbi:MAG TPA: helix-turn-helix transcriptional regulator [Gemmataceae bacterium]|nr:helix-turn-helix transcriptional regulator [Gemmataceae bacterium]
MSDTAKLPKIERTPEQMAEEKRIRELHRQSPIVAVPADTIRGADAAQLFKFVAAIRREREAQGLTLELLAERTGMDVNVLSRMEAGNGLNPPVSILFRLSRALGKNLVLSLESATSGPSA